MIQFRKSDILGEKGEFCRRNWPIPPDFGGDRFGYLPILRRGRAENEFGGETDFGRRQKVRYGRIIKQCDGGFKSARLNNQI